MILNTKETLKMKKLEVTAYDIAQRFVGIKEVEGSMSNPQILAMLQLDDVWPKDDSVPWCSAFVSYIAWLLGPTILRSQSLRARSWLNIGKPIVLAKARQGFDVAVFKRGIGNQPGPEIINASGHVGFFSYWFEENDRILILGGNQSNSVSLASYPVKDLLGIRRLI